MIQAKGDALYYHQNRIYSVMAMTDASGAAAERYAYTPYGERTVMSPANDVLAKSAVGNDVGFTGRYFDAETELWYYRARMMSSELGRFLAKDPLADLPTRGRP